MDKTQTTPGMPAVVTASGAADNVKRGIRTGTQAVAGFLVAVPVLAVWNNYVQYHEIHDPTLKFALAAILTALVAWAQNRIEDKTGVAFLAPTDRKAGDAVLQAGLGQKTGALVGDTSPATPTQYVVKAP